MALGSFAWDGFLAAAGSRGIRVRPKPRFAHGGVVTVGPYAVVGCFHPSQQNTFTGKLTPSMLDEVMGRARGLAGLRPSA